LLIGSEMTASQKDEYFMRLALKEAKIAADHDEIPVGAVFISEGKVITSSRNQCEMLTDPTAHAEIIGITQACAALEVQRLTAVDLYVTKEPCVMCAGALVHARIRRLVIGAPDIKAGACGSILQLVKNEKLNHSIQTVFGVLEDECRAILQEFFKSKRG